MKLLSISFLSFLSGSATGFVPHSAPRSASPFGLKSVTSLNVAAPQMTKFDRLKRDYKGPKASVDTSGVSFTYEAFEEAVAATTYNFNRNDVIKGTIVQYENGGALVDIGAKASAFLPLAEAGLVTENANERSNIEDMVVLDVERDFQIISEEDENGQLMVSIRRIEYRQAWERIVKLQEEDDVFEAEVVAVNRGGAIALVEGLRAFLPGSHLTGALPDDDLIGVTLPLKFLEVNQEANKLVVSNRRAVVEKQMKDLSRGDVVEGIIKALKPYGAFVEVGGMSGLLHISQISYDRIDDLEAVFAPGTKVKCMIIDHDKVNGRIALSTKTLEPEPGDMLKDSDRVFELADQTAAKYHERMEAERKAREEAAKDIVMGLGDGLEVSDPLADVTDSLESVLDSEEANAEE
ncbi:hypothetical protein TrLO_g15900 [Triparma laevis f. longispina]|uniref:S1 motif domain-containing protein n=1 Tax=Triparma laevis f. longispina TaxID=1714387 RepID=A0A9W6ZXI4_9STRA|nr:hypothetical protein TrLO_g15900 [Triparma laevis f. longispina]